MRDPAAALARRDAPAGAPDVAAPPASGFDAVEAAWRLLRRFGHEGGLQAFRDAQDLRGSAEALAEPLERAGIQARLATIVADELAFLDLPTIVQLRDGTWLVLAERRGNAVELEGVEGTRVVRVEALAPHLSGNALDLSPSLPEGKGLWRRIAALLLRQRKALVLLAVATGVLQLLALVLPEITAAVMDTALPDRAISTLRVVSVGVILVAAFQACVGWIRERILVFLVTRVEVSAERGLLQHLLRLPFSELGRMTVGERLQTIAGFSSAREVLAERSIAAVLDGLTAIVLVVAMALKMPLPALLVLAATAVMSVIALLVGSVQARLQARELAAQAREQGYLSELIAGVATVKAAGAEAQGLERWTRRYGEGMRHELRRERLGLWSNLGIETLRQGLYVALLVWGGSLILDGELRVGTLLAFTQLSSAFLGAAFGLVRTGLAVIVLRPQLTKAKEILDKAPQPRPARRRPAAERGVPVVLEDVWFRYAPESPWIARGYGARFEAGEKAVITGPSGFGKSTILRLLAGLYAPEEGTISVGGSSPQAAASEVLYLPQFVNLFGGSLAENLRILSGGAPMQRLLEVAEETGLAELVATWPMGWHTVITPGGRSISGGQRQLIVLTAALASDRRLLLLDEAMSNLDPVRAVKLRELLDAHPATVIEARHVVA